MMAKTANAGLSVGLVYDDSLDGSDGVAQYVKTLGAWLTANGHRVTYLAGQTSIKTWSGGEVISAAYNLKIRWGGNNLSMPVWPRASLIRRVIKDKSFDVLHVQLPYSPLMSQYAIKHVSPRAAVIGTFHVFPGNRRSGLGASFLKLIYGSSLGRFDQIVSVSPAAADFAKKSMGIQSKVVPNAIELSRFQSRSPVSKKRPRIVFLGRLVRRKGCMELLEAFKRLHSRLPEAELIIAGDGPLRAGLERYVKKNELSGRVSFLGFISEADKPGLLKSADIACFPSLYGESFGIVLAEAMAAGAQVVLGGDNPGYQSVLGEQPLLLIDPSLTDDFSRRLEELLTNKSAIKKLHSWQTSAVKQYDVERVGPRLVEIYHQQIAQRIKKSNN